jgi:hypothetical protein
VRNQKKEIKIMDWTQILTIVVPIILANLGIILPMFFWLRSEANSDRRQFQQESASDRRDILQLIRNIHEEIKDFHGRLCIIEERAKK